MHAGISDLGTARLSRLVSLESLSLDMRSIGDGGVRNLSGLTNLRHLDLFGAKVSDTGCAWLRCCHILCPSTASSSSFVCVPNGLASSACTLHVHGKECLCSC